MNHRDAIITQIDKTAEYPLAAQLKDWLERKDTRLISDRSAKVSVAEARRLWTTRLKNTDVTGQRLLGADLLLDHLKEFKGQRQLDHFAFVGPKVAANVFLDRASHNFVGAVLVRHGR